MPAEYKMLGNLAAEKGKMQLAGKCYRKAAELEPYDKNTYYELGVSLFKEEHYEEAIIELQKYLQNEIVRPEAYFYLAYAFLHLGKLDKAEAYFRKVLRLKPNDAYTYVGLGVIAQTQKNLAQAKEHYEKALALDPACQEARENLSYLQ